MLFTSPQFLFGFLPTVVAVYFLVPARFRGGRNAWLLAASLFFYGAGEPGFVGILAISCLVNWAAGALVAPGRPLRRAALALAVAANLGLLFRFKYLAFAAEQCDALFGTAFAIRGVALPLGISFFTFQAMSYVIDVFRGVSAPQRNPLDVALYIVLFPQLVAGPIVRYETVAEQIRGRRENPDDFAAGLVRFTEGLAKKMLLANQLAVVADSAFDGANWLPAHAGAAGPGPFSASLAWLGAIAYALQIYFDFSGYSDMAIGLGRMFGFRFLENFRHPYVSCSVSEFWRRWHISMGTWFRDYVYFPLGGSRVRTKGRLVANLLAVWLLTGLWHGAAWTFVVWGLMYFALIAAEKTLRLPERLRGRAGAAVGRIYTLLFVLVGWVLFRARSLGAAGAYLGAMVGVGTDRFADPLTWLLVRNNLAVFATALILCAPVAAHLSAWADARLRTPAARAARTAVAAAWTFFLFVASLSFIASGSHNPFIYFNF